MGVRCTSGNHLTPVSAFGAVLLLYAACESAPQPTMFDPLVADLIPGLSFSDTGAAVPRRLPRVRSGSGGIYASPLPDTAEGFRAMIVFLQRKRGQVRPGAPIHSLWFDSDSSRSGRAAEWARRRLTSLYGEPIRDGCVEGVEFSDSTALKWQLPSGESATLIVGRSRSGEYGGFWSTKLFLDSNLPVDEEPTDAGTPCPVRPAEKHE